ncbi:MAG: sortase [Candidatus Dormibacteria bacterium]
MEALPSGVPPRPATAESDATPSFPALAGSTADRLVASAGPEPDAPPLRPARPRWLSTLALVAVVALVLGGLALIGGALFGSIRGGQLPGSPELPAWQIVGGIVVLALVLVGARVYRRGGAEGAQGKRGKGWRRLIDSRIIGSVVGALFLLAAVLMYNTPGYTPDIRALPGEVSGLLQQAVASKEQGYPRIRISRVHVDLLLVKGDGKTPPVKYEAFTYPNADHLLAEQGTPGNTYVYAHARTGMFWELHDLNIGDTIEVDYGGGKVVKFAVTELHRSVSWKDFSWLQPTGDDRLTLQTCNGWRDEDPRFIVVAKKKPDTKSALR